MFKRNGKDHPLTKGGALILARNILGPHAFVLLDLGANPTVIGRRGQYQGDTWEQALERARESDEAKTYADSLIAYANTLGEALDSLKATTKKVVEEGTKFLSKKQTKDVRKGLGGVA